MSMRLKLKRAKSLRRRHFDEMPDSDKFLSREEWAKIRDIICDALEPHMEARIAVAEALMQYEKSKQSEL